MTIVSPLFEAAEKIPMMPEQLSLYPQLFVCDGDFNVTHHGEAIYVVTTVFWPNGKDGNKVRYTPRYLCEECLKELNRRRASNECLDQYNDFEIKKI